MHLRCSGSLLAVFGALALVSSTASAAPLYKCKDPYGRIVYADTDCRTDLPRVTVRPAEPKKEAAAPAAAVVPAAPAARVDKLTVAAVEEVLQKAREFGDKDDFAGECALAAPDISFTLVDRSISPEMRKTGGRDEICRLQRESTQAARAAGLSSRSTLDQIKVQVNADGTQATAKYLQNARILLNGSPAFGMQCDRDDTLALYDGKVLFKRATSTCTPVK